MESNTGQIQIRTAAVGDARTLTDMGRVTFAQSYASIIPAQELASYTAEAFSTERLSSELANRDIIYLLAVVKGGVCGYVKLEPTPASAQATTPNPIELVRLYAVPGDFPRRPRINEHRRAS